MRDLTAVEIKAFVPAKDFELSKIMREVAVLAATYRSTQS